jgi:glucose/arabinose dehydrogenase
MNRVLHLFLISCLLLINASTQAEIKSAGSSEGIPFRVERVADDLGIVWGMVFIEPETLLFTERAGKAALLNVKTGEISELSGVPPVRAEGQGGLLDVALPPRYQPGGWIYFTYVKSVNDSGVTVLARAKAKLDKPRLTSWQNLLVTRSASDTSRHFGSRIAFDGKGYVYFSIGDRGVRPNGQDLTTHAGTVIRLHLDGSVPHDNPFVNASGALPEIWSYGHRNPQGLVYDLEKDRLWLGEHGPRGGDEINLIQKGRNYGWPVISHGKEYWAPMQVGEGIEKEGMEQPMKYYNPSIAPGSLLLYNGEAFPRWKGNLFSGALKLTHLNRVVLDDEGRAIAEERLFEKDRERIRALAESPGGWLYFSVDSGAIYRIRPDS